MIHKIKQHFPQFFACILFCLFVVAYFFPEKLWGIHFNAFLPLPFTLLFLGIPIVLIFLSLKQYNFFKLAESSKPQALWNWWCIGITIFTVLLSYQFPLVNDFYGNARGFIPELDQKINSIPAANWKHFFSFQFEPGQGRNSVKLMVDALALLFDLTVKQGFYLLNGLFLALYSFTWLRTVGNFVSPFYQRIVWAIIGLSTPLLLIYFGHIETYAPVYFLLLLWLVLLVKQIQAPRKSNLLLLFLLLLIGFKFHSLFILLTPPLVLVGLRTLKINNKEFKPSFKTIFYKVYLPLMFLGIMAYFFVFEDHKDPRTLSNFKDIDRLFLPLFSPEAPLDKYNLFSFNHVLDFINMSLLWSPVIVFLTVLLLYYRKKIDWNYYPISILSLCALIFISFLFAINPLFSMAMDWDLLLFPVPILLVLLLVVYSKHSFPIKHKQLSILCIALSILNLPAFAVMTGKSSNSARIETVGIHIFKSYYEHASTYILYAINESESEAEFLAREDRVLKTLAPFALKGNDKQYADLLLDRSINAFYIEKDPLAARVLFLESTNYHYPKESWSSFIREVNQALTQKDFTEQELAHAEQFLKQGKLVLKDSSNYDKAIRLFSLASYYAPLSGPIAVARLECYFKQQRFNLAYQDAKTLVKLNYPTARKALRIALHTSLEAGFYDQALKQSKRLSQLAPDDQLNQQLLERLLAADRVNELKYLFQSQH